MSATDRPVVDLPYSKKNIAARLSLQPETLSRAFHRMTDGGVADIDGPMVRIRDLDALRKLAIDG